MTDVSIAQILAHFRDLVEIVDQAVINAARAQEDAEQAHRVHVETAGSTSDSQMRHAIVQARTAAEKAGKTSRLLAEAAGHFTNYINIIAPGTVPDRVSAPEATPTGERITSEAGERATFNSLFNRALKKADDVKDAVSSTTKAVAEGAKSGSKQSMLRPPTPPSAVSTGTASAQPVFRPAHQNSATVHDGVSAITIGLISVALVGKKLATATRKRKADRHEDQG